jgi:hypothetical protein
MNTTTQLHPVNGTTLRFSIQNRSPPPITGVHFTMAHFPADRRIPRGTVEGAYIRMANLTVTTILNTAWHLDNDRRAGITSELDAG